MQHKAEPKPKQEKFLGISTAHPWKSSTWIPGSALRDSQATLMAVLRAGIQQSLPLPLLIQSLASEYPGGYRITLLKLAKLLEQGVPLIDALEQVPDALSEHDVLGLRLGKQSGMLIPALLEMKSTEAENITTPGLRLWRDAWIYWLVVIGIMLVVITYIKYRVAGTLRNINAELGISNPLRFMSGFLDSVLWIGGIFLVIVVFLIATGWSFRLRRWIRGMFGFPASHIGESNVSVLRLLGMTVKNGRPLVGALSTIAKYHTHGAIRNKMLLARNEIEQGPEHAYPPASPMQHRLPFERHKPIPIPLPLQATIQESTRQCPTTPDGRHHSAMQMYPPGSQREELNSPPLASPTSNSTQTTSCHCSPPSPTDSPSMPVAPSSHKHQASRPESQPLTQIRSPTVAIDEYSYAGLLAKKTPFARKWTDSEYGESAWRLAPNGSKGWTR